MRSLISLISITIFLMVFMATPLSANSYILIDNVVVERDGEDVKRPIPIADFVEMVRKNIALLEEQIRQLGIVPINTITIDRNLEVGSGGDDVRKLQILLNSMEETRLAVSGPGSPGQETVYFGLLTQNAVLRFQQKYGLTTTGAVDESTRIKINSLFVR